VAGVSPRVLQLFEITTVDKFFPRIATAEEADGLRLCGCRLRGKELRSNTHISESRYGVPGHPPALVLWFGWGRGRVLVMAVVEDFADAATCALGDFACALTGTDADVLAGDGCAFADVACGLTGVEGDEIAGAFADALGCRSGSLGGALADVAGPPADVTAGAAGFGLGRGLSLGRGLGWGGCGLGVLGANVLGVDGEG